MASFIAILGLLTSFFGGIEQGKGKQIAENRIKPVLD